MKCLWDINESMSQFITLCYVRKINRPQKKTFLSVISRKNPFGIYAFCVTIPRHISRNDDSQHCAEVRQRNDAGTRLSYRRLIGIFLSGRSIGTTSQRTPRSNREIRFRDNAHREIGPQSSRRLRLTDIYNSAIFLENARRRSIDRPVSPTPLPTKARNKKTSEIW